MTDKIKIVHVEGAGREIADDTKIVRYIETRNASIIAFRETGFHPEPRDFRKFGPLGDGHSL